jgi:hypothetical protein
LVRLGNPIFWKVASSNPSVWETLGITFTALFTTSPFGSSTTSLMKFVPIACRFLSSLILPFGASSSIAARPARSFLWPSLRSPLMR